MPKHIYDKDGNYKGKILSDEEHRKKRFGVGGKDFCKKCKGCENIFYEKGFQNERIKLLIDDESWYFYCGKCLPYWYYSSRFVLIWIILFFPIGIYGLYYRTVNGEQIKKWRKNNKVEKITVHSFSILNTIIMLFKSANKFRLHHLVNKSKQKK